MSEENIVTETTDVEDGKTVLTGGNEQVDDGSGTDATGDETTAEAAPEEYEPFALPEGAELDEELLGEFKVLAKEYGLTQEKAQKLIDFQAKSAQTMVDAQAKAWASLQSEWSKAAQTDKEYGGKAFKENLGVAVHALDKFGTKALREALDATGVGNHPEFIRFFYNVGKAINEDKVHVGGNPHGEARDPAKVLYPDMN